MHLLNLGDVPSSTLIVASYYAPGIPESPFIRSSR